MVEHLPVNWDVWTAYLLFAFDLLVETCCTVLLPFAVTQQSCIIQAAQPLAHDTSLASNHVSGSYLQTPDACVVSCCIALVG